MAKAKEKPLVSKISVGIYADEFEAVIEKLDIEECTPREIRKGLGLAETKSKTGYASKIRELVKNKTKEEQEELYNDLKDEE